MKQWNGKHVPRWKRSKVTQKIYALCRRYYGKVSGNEFKEILFNYIDGKLNAARLSSRRKQGHDCDHGLGNMEFNECYYCHGR